jgi:hypothetical protein
LTLRFSADTVAPVSSKGHAIDRISRIAGHPALWLCCLAAALAGEAGLLDHLSLSYDELFSIYFAEQGPGFLLGPGWHQETNPPLYFLLLDGWIGLFGDSAVAVRALSLLAGAATIWVVFRIAQALGLRQGAWLAAALFPTSALAARYAVMARPYALWLLAVALALLALIEASRAATPRRLAAWALAFAAAALAALYLHNATLVFLVVAEAAFLLDWLLRRRTEPRLLLAWLVPQLVLVAALPQLLILFGQRNSANIAWIPPLDMLGVIQIGLELLSGRPYPFGSFQAPAFLMTLALLLVLVPLRARRDQLVVSSLVPLGVALLIAAGLLLPRSALWLLLPLAVLQGAAIESLRTRWLRLALGGAAVLLAGLNTAACLWEYDPEPWRDFLGIVEAERRPEDVIVLMNGAPATALRYYQVGAGAAVYRWDATEIDAPGTAIRGMDDHVMLLPSIDGNGIEGLLRDGHGVWLIRRLRAQSQFHDVLAAQFPPDRRLSRYAVQVMHLPPHTPPAPATPPP